MACFGGVLESGWRQQQMRVSQEEGRDIKNTKFKGRRSGLSGKTPA